MTLVTSARLLVAARAGGYAVGAFNTSNLGITEAILAAAREGMQEAVRGKMRLFGSSGRA